MTWFIINHVDAIIQNWGFVTYLSHSLLIISCYQDFISKLVTLVPEDRLTVKEALEHPWVTVSETPLLTTFCDQAAKSRVFQSAALGSLSDFHRGFHPFFIQGDAAKLEPMVGVGKRLAEMLLKKRETVRFNFENSHQYLIEIRQFEFTLEIRVLSTLNSFFTLIFIKFSPQVLKRFFFQLLAPIFTPHPALTSAESHSRSASVIMKLTRHVFHQLAQKGSLQIGRVLARYDTKTPLEEVETTFDHPEENEEEITADKIDFRLFYNYFVSDGASNWRLSQVIHPCTALKYPGIDPMSTLPFISRLIASFQ